MLACVPGHNKLSAQSLILRRYDDPHERGIAVLHVSTAHS